MILVTGASGFLGSHLLFELAKQNRKIRAVKRPSSDISNFDMVCGFYNYPPENLKNAIEWVDADLTNPADFAFLLKDIETVYHCAAMVSFNPAHRKKMMNYNISSTTNLVNACLKNPGIFLCHVSSIAALGNSENGKPIDENCKWTSHAGKSYYALSKYLSEMEVWRGINEGLNAVIVNPSVILGPWHQKQGSSFFFYRVKKGMPFYTSGVTGFTDVTDVVKAMIFLTENKISGQKIILNSENISYKKLFSIIAVSVNKKPPSIKIPAIMLKVIAMTENMLSKIFNYEPGITPEVARAAYNISNYSNLKAINLGIHFKPIEQTIKIICNIDFKTF